MLLLFSVTLYVAISFDFVFLQSGDCTTLWQCWWKSFMLSFLGSSATMSKVEMSRRIEMEPFLWGQGDARTFFEVLFNVGAFLFFVLLLQNLIIGIIFDQFAGMRNNDAEMREDAATCCLVATFIARNALTAAFDAVGDATTATEAAAVSTTTGAPSSSATSNIAS